MAVAAVTLAVQSIALGAGPAAASSRDPVAAALARIDTRLEALERHNAQLQARVDELTRQNEVLRAAVAPPAALADTAARSRAEFDVDALDGAPADAAPIRFKSDFRYRHQRTEDGADPEGRERDTIRARFSAAMQINAAISGEIGVATGGANPRGASVTLGSAESRKDIGLDLAYMTWRPRGSVALTAGKMRYPYERPGQSRLFDNDVRPEGVALTYERNGWFGSAFGFWVEERALADDSTLFGGQMGWKGRVGAASLTVGAGFFDYGAVRGRFPGFADGLVAEFGNTVTGTGADARFAYDYNISEGFAEIGARVAGVPVSAFADHAYNHAARNGLNTAYSVGFLVGQADRTGRWEAGALRQKVEKDALFAQWTDSSFASGVSDNEGQGYRLAWRAMDNLLLNLTYYDTHYQVDVGERRRYRSWQLDFNLATR